MAKHGGARANSGPRTAPKGDAPEINRELVDQFLDDLVRDLPLYYETIRELARGIKVALRPGSNGRKPGEYLGDAEDPESGELWSVYLVRPDGLLLSRLMEQAAGRAGQREAVQSDPVIVVRHGIPGHRDVGELPGTPQEGPSEPQQPPAGPLLGLGLPQL